MDFTIDPKLIERVVIANCCYDDARKKLSYARDTLSRDVQRMCVEMGMGDGAIVSHVHAAAHFGNQSDKVVRSKIVGADFGTDVDRRYVAKLRIRLGTVKGEISYSYSTIRIDDVIEIVEPSMTAFD